VVKPAKSVRAVMSWVACPAWPACTSAACSCLLRLTICHAAARGKVSTRCLLIFTANGRSGNGCKNGVWRRVAAVVKPATLVRVVMSSVACPAWPACTSAACSCLLHPASCHAAAEGKIRSTVVAQSGNIMSGTSAGKATGEVQSSGGCLRSSFGESSRWVCPA